MRAAFVLLLLGLLGSPASADQFDDWCRGVTLPSSVAICSDPGLLELTRERQRAYDVARARIGEAGASRLLADQKGWVASYPTACGVAPDRPPALPLAPPVRDCMTRAGRERIAYLTSYGLSAPVSPQPSFALSGATSSSVPIGPSFDCAKASGPLGKLICADANLSRIDLRFNQAYFALRQVLDPDGRRRLEEEDLEFLNLVTIACGVPESGPPAGSPECVAAHYNRKRSEWVSRLSGAAREEANRDIERHVALQGDLQRLGHLPQTAKVDGVYSSATRGAISTWQSAAGRTVSGIISDVDATALHTAAPSPMAAISPVGRPERPDGVTPTPSAPTLGGDVTEVSLKQRGGVFRVPVRINDTITLDFTVDSGASDVMIPADVVLTLIRTETLSSRDFLGEKTYVLADGSKLPSARFNVRELRVGGHRLENVTASAGPAAGDPLLGQSFLSRFKTWAFDNDRHVLVLMKAGPQLAAPKALVAPGPIQAAISDAPLFDQYPAGGVYRGSATMPDFDGRDREFKTFRTRIRNGIGEGANFAGRFKVVQFGCGTGCSFVLVADVSTGRVYNFPRGGENDQMLRLDYRVTSNLIRARWVPSFDKRDACLGEDLLWKDGQFTSLKPSAPMPCPRD